MPVLAWGGVPYPEATLERYRELAEAGFTINFSGASNADMMQKLLDLAHAHGVKRRGLIGETGDHDGDDIGMESVQILQELQPVVARGERDVRDGSAGREDDQRAGEQDDSLPRPQAAALDFASASRSMR